MQKLRILSDEQFRQLTTDEKYLYINEMLYHIVHSRPGGRPVNRVGERLEKVAQGLSDEDYARMPDAQKIRYLENLIGELIGTVTEAQRALSALRAPPVSR